MSDLDPDRIRFFSTEENFNPVYLISEFKKQIASLNEYADIIAKSRSSRISDRRFHISKDMLNAFEKTMLAYNGFDKIGQLSTKDQQDILVMVDDILRGKREYVHLQLNRNCDGIRELFSDKTFKIKKQSTKDEKGQGS